MITPEEQNKNRDKLRAQNNRSVIGSHSLVKRMPLVTKPPANNEPADVISITGRRKQEE